MTTSERVVTEGSATSLESRPRELNPGAVLELGEPPQRAWPRVTSAGGVGIGSHSLEDDLAESPFQGEAGSAAVRQGRGRDEPQSMGEARGRLWEARVAVHDLFSSRM